MPRARVSLLLVALLLSSPALAMPMHHAMSDADMVRVLNAWYAVHRQSPPSSIPASAVVDTIYTGAGNHPQFDADRNLDTVLDTLTIAQGTTVLWKWVWGAHSTTSGRVDDLDAGSIWDHSIAINTPEFSYTFNDVGDFPYFCAVDQQVMTGMIVVEPAVSADSRPGARVGFLAKPFPNPSSGDVTFRFAVREAGRARAEVFDARGSLVARPLDRALSAGSQFVSWDGRNLRGERASTGVYYLRLRLPGYAGGQSFVLDR